MGRLFQLQQTLPINLEQSSSWPDVEFVVLNYNSPDELHTWMQDVMKKYVTCGRIIYRLNPEPTRFHSSKAKNQAHRLATGDVLVNLDADNFIGESIAVINEAFNSSTETCLHLHSGKFGDGTYGRIALSKRNFNLLGGYDESFLPMGGQDVDLIRRSSAYGLNFLHVKDKRIGHALQNSRALKMKYTGFSEGEYDFHNATNLSQMHDNLRQNKVIANQGVAWGQASQLLPLEWTLRTTPSTSLRSVSQPKRKRYKIFVVNDTASVHSGGQAVMRSLYALIAGHEVVNVCSMQDKPSGCDWETAIDKSDVVLVNGEGSMSHNSARSKFIIRILEKASQQEKKCLLVNSVFEMGASIHSDVFKKLSVFTVRDPYSHIAAAATGANASLFPDLVLNGDFANTAPSKHFRNKIVVGRAANKFMSGLNEIARSKNHPRQYLDLPFEDCVANLRRARLYITGQCHGIYAAILADIPFVPLPGNLREIESLIRWGRFPIRLCKNIRFIEDHIRFANSNRALYKEFGAFIRSLPRLQQSHLAL